MSSPDSTPLPIAKECPAPIPPPRNLRPAGVEYDGKGNIYHIYMQPIPPIVSSEVLAGWLGMHPRTVKKLMKGWHLGPYNKIGTKYVVRTDKLLKTLQRREYRSAPEPFRSAIVPNPQVLELLKQKVGLPPEPARPDVLPEPPRKGRGWWRSPRPELPTPDPIIVGQLQGWIRPKEAQRLEAERKVGKDISEELARLKAERGSRY
ncbi:MAG: hypothetical protein FD180_151 [Planctomycetota bacterium]|nr:MAG: hypothetical protein FD180_151 [Planctomycetota bacterium]